MNDLEPEAHYPEQFHSFILNRTPSTQSTLGKTSKGLKVTLMNYLMR